MANSEFKLILEDISRKLNVLIEYQNLLIRKLDRAGEETRLHLMEIRRISEALGKTYVKAKRGPNFT